MNYRIRFADGTVFACPEGTTAPIRHVHTSDRDFRRITVVGEYADVAAKFVDGASYVYEWDSYVDDETTEVISQDYSEYSIAGEIVATRDGNITVFMSKPTEVEILRKTLEGLVSDGILARGTYETLKGVKI